MRSKRSVGTRWSACAILVVGVLVALLFVTGGDALAKKPVQPPPPPPDPGDIGTIFLNLGADLYEMAGDGTDRTLLPVHSDDWQYAPSETLHGGERWFLMFKPVEGEAYPSTYPRNELHAVSESGAEVRLHADPNLEPVQPPGAFPQWSVESGIVDGKVSQACKHWVWDPLTEEWGVDAWGLYVAYLDPADLADGQDLDLAWTRLPLDIPLRSSGPEGGWFACRHHWTPDGTRFVYDDSGFDAAGNIYVAETGTSAWTQTLVGSGTSPRWSPDATRILFNAPDGIHTMSPTGADVQLLVADPPDTGKASKWLFTPFWSPSGTHVIYVYVERPSNTGKRSTRDLFRVGADGTGSVNLTEDEYLNVHGLYGWLDE